MRKKRILAIIIALSLFNACEEETTEIGVTEITATFTGDFSQPGADPGILFYSNMDREVLWTGTWIGNDTLHATLASGFPERMAFTTITESEQYGSKSVRIATNMNVKPDSYIWQGGGSDYRWSENLGQIYFNPINVFDHAGYIISSDRTSSSSSGALSSTRYLRAYSEVSDVFVRVDPINGVPMYTWIEDVHPGDTITIDFNRMSEMASINISAPETEFDRTINIYGVLHDYYSGKYRIHKYYPYEDEDRIGTIYYPTDEFSEFVTRLYVDEESYPTRNGWYSTWISANIPSTLNFADIDFEFKEDPDHEVAIETSDQYTQISYHWDWIAGDDTYYSWSLYTDLNEITRPSLPPEFHEAYPGFELDSLTLNQVLVSQADDLGYDAYIESFFKSGLGIYNLFSTIQDRRRDPVGLRPESTLPKDQNWENVVDYEDKEPDLR